jgi:hypothetical protein
MEVAQFIAVCSSSILAETLGYAASFSRPLRGKRRILERRKPLLIDQLQPSTNADKLSEHCLLQHSRVALVGFRGRGCAEGIQHDFLSPSLP